MDVNECHSIDGGPCDGKDCLNTDGDYYCLGTGLDPIQQDGHLIGAETVAVAGISTGALVGASISTMVLTVLLCLSVALGYRWIARRQKQQQTEQ